jgi:hypothetical protein
VFAGSETIRPRLGVRRGKVARRTNPTACAKVYELLDGATDVSPGWSAPRSARPAKSRDLQLLFVQLKGRAESRAENFE